MVHDSTVANLRNRLRHAEARADRMEEMWLETQERAERGADIGPCRECKFWERPQPMSRKYKWGWCLQTVGTLHHADWPWRGDPSQRIATNHAFGCIKFEPTPRTEEQK